RALRPFELERVARRLRRVEVALERPGDDPLAGLLEDLAEVDRLTRGWGMARLLGELASGDVDQRLARIRLALRQGPGSEVAAGMERATRMGEEDLESVGRPAVEQQSGARPAALVDRHRCKPSGPARTECSMTRRLGIVVAPRSQPGGTGVGVGRAGGEASS